MKIKLLMPIIFLGICVVIWQLTTGGGLVSAWMLPAPGQVVTALIGSWELLVLHTTQTLWEAVAGFGLAIIVAILLAVLMILLWLVSSGWRINTRRKHLVGVNKNLTSGRVMPIGCRKTIY